MSTNKTDQNHDNGKTNHEDGTSTCLTVWKNLIDWVHSQDRKGFIHPSLILAGTGPSRGVVVVSTPIVKGELLIRIPPSCVISGVDIPSAALPPTNQNYTAKSINSPPPPSPWLRCLASYLQAKRECKDFEKSRHYCPYFQSLPSAEDYETLMQWTKEEIQNYLCGTTLGKVLILDRNEHTSEKRYKFAVEPFLKNLGILETHPYQNHPFVNNNSSIDLLPESNDYQLFIEATMCISTRGFHLMDVKPEEIAEEKQQSYNGPFLLPVIDLLNHDPAKACTTLQRDASTGDFVMVAERPLNVGEDVVHSYGDSLTSAQLLQTFGFVPSQHTYNAIALEVTATSGSVDKSTNADPSCFLTPVCLHKTDHLLVATMKVKNSAYPQNLKVEILNQRTKFEHSKTDVEKDIEDEDDKFWDVHDIPDRRMSDSIPDEFLVSKMEHQEKVSTCLLTEDIITFLTVQFLPDEAFSDIFSEEGSSTRLDRSILSQDYYLGKLVCQSLLIAIAIKATAYTKHFTAAEVTDDDFGASTMQQIAEIQQNHKERLSDLMREISSTIQEKREIYGKTICLEELTNLLALCTEVEGLTTSLNLFLYTGSY